MSAPEAGARQEMRNQFWWEPSLRGGGREGDREHSSRIEISKMLESAAIPTQREVHVELL